MKQLSQNNLKYINKSVSLPKYSREGLSASWYHFGVGGFHRAHQAMLADELLNLGGNKKWGICGIGVMPEDKKMQTDLAEQDYLYTLLVKNPDGSKDTRIISSIIDIIYAPDDFQEVINRLASPDTKIVSLTITEGGYNINPLDGEFDFENSLYLHDINNPDAPKTAFGLIIAALKKRQELSLEPFTILSCDNIQENGKVAAKAIISLARTIDVDLAKYIEGKVSFPNTMVDRITPVTTMEDVIEVEQITSLKDKRPVVCEPFWQWVIEDDFTLGRPNFEDVSCEIVHDVNPFELMKLRLLNASHQAIAYFGYLMGHYYVHDALKEDLIVKLLRKYMNDEASDTLLPVPGIDLFAYKEKLIERFSNSEIADTIPRLAVDASDRISQWLVPVIQERSSMGMSSPLCAAIVASWSRYAEGLDENGVEINIVDRRKVDITKSAKNNHTNPVEFLKNKELFGDLASDEEFVTDYLKALNLLHKVGARETLNRLLS